MVNNETARAALRKQHTPLHLIIRILPTTAHPLKLIVTTEDKQRRIL